MEKATQLSLAQIAQLIEGQLSGDASFEISSIARLDEARAGDITLVANQHYLKKWEASSASAFIVYQDFPATERNIIRVAQPFQAFYKIAAFFHKSHETLTPGIHPTAIIGEGTVLGEDISIGPSVVIGRDCKIGSHVKIHPGVVISDGVTVGEGSIIYQNVTIREDCRVGKNVIIHCGVVIGSDGFGFHKENNVFKKIPQLGFVIIEDDVEIGANCTIDRATVGTTRIGKGTKLDNLIQVGHNVVIGENTVIAAQTGIAGSTKIGDEVMMGGQVGLKDHIEVGDHAILGAQCGVTKSVPPNTMVSGYPAREHLKAKREEAIIRKLPELYKTIRKATNHSRTNLLFRTWFTYREFNHTYF